MGKALFVIGTDTGVGKTIISAIIISALRRKGLSVCPLKPVETGCRKRGGSIIPEDSRFLSSICGNLPIKQVNTYCFRYPLAPAVAAEFDNKKINIKHILTNIQKAKEKFDIVIVEGAGGLLVPLTWDVTFLDLVSQMRIPIIIVAANKLGTINHTLLTVQLAKIRNINIIGIVLNTIHKNRDLSRKTNAYAIEKLAKVPIIGEIPFIERIKSRNACFFADLSTKYLNLDLITDSLGFK